MLKNDDLDEVVLAIVNFTSLKDSISRLYVSGDISDCQLCECVARKIITLSDYNDIVEGL